MTTTVADNPEQTRYEISVDGVPAGFTEYHVHGMVAAFIHTEIAPEFGGRGLASALIEEALDDARRRAWTVEPFCPFVRAFILKHAEYLDLVAPADRVRFDLPAAP